MLPRTEQTVWQLDVSITLDGNDYRATVSSPRGIGPADDTLPVLTLLPAMKAGVGLELREPVSARLLSALPLIQDIFCTWDPDRFERVAVKATPRPSGAGAPAAGVGCFFSGGLDSFYTLLKRREEVTHLIFAHGFDIPLKDERRNERAVQAAQAVADELGMTLIEVHTNLAPFSNAVGVGWSHYHGAGLAAVAHLFQDRLGRVLIPASLTYADLAPWGTHPLLDPLWSTERTVFEHHGCEANRVQKAAYISEHPVAMRHLRVCLQHETEYNCGRCEKCLRTIINLRAAGAPGRCETLPERADPEAVANLDLGENPLYLILAQDNLEALERSGRDPELARALATAMDRSAETHRVTRQLDLTRKELADTARRLHQLGKKHRDLRQRLHHHSEKHRELRSLLTSRTERLEEANRELAGENADLKHHHASRRYRLADAVADTVLKIPGAKRLFHR